MNYEILKPSEDFFHVRDKFYPHYIYSDKQVTSGAKALYVYLFNNCQQGLVTKSYLRLAEILCVTEKTIRNQIKVLANLGYVEIKSNGYKQPNTYSLLKSPKIIQFLESEESIMSKSRKGKNLQGKNYRQLKELKNNLTPLTPPSAPVILNGAGNEVVFHEPTKQILPIQRKLAEKMSEFYMILEAYPNKNEVGLAKRAYLELLDKGAIPVVSTMLDIIEAFKALDSRWKNGYVPLLKNFLRFGRFRETPLVRKENTFNFNKIRQEEKVENISLPAEKIAFYKTTIENLTSQDNTKRLSSEQEKRVLAVNQAWSKKAQVKPEIEGFIKASFANTEQPEFYISHAEEFLRSQSPKIPLGDWIKNQKNIFSLPKVANF